MISPDQVEAVRRATDIVDVAQGYLNLTPSGRNFKALCPFHQEKTPSFIVNPERQTYKCFGCQLGGDIFSFLMELESITFPESVRLLADRVGISIEDTASGDSEPRHDRARLAEALAFASNLYEQVLHRSPVGEPGRLYLKSRGISQELAKAWRLGYAPPDRDFVIARAGKAGFAMETLEAAGLCYPAREGLPSRDCFSRRVMFPIYNTRDQIAGFGGRALEKDNPRKYINSSDGPLFLKRRLLYGLSAMNRARREKPDLRAEPVYVAEGYLDVMALHAAGIETAVAPLGTALTPDHVRSLRPTGSTVVLVFDGDGAGASATERALAELTKQDVDAAVTRALPGKDPFDIYQQDGPEALAATVRDTVSAYDFLLARAQEASGDTVEGRASAAQALGSVLGGSPNPVKREGYLRQAAFDLRTTEAALRRLWDEPGRPGAADTAAAVTPRLSRDTRAEIDLALALLGAPALVRRAAERVPLKAIVDSRVRNLVGALYDLSEEDSEVESAQVLSRLQGDPEAHRLAADLLEEADRRLEMARDGRTDRDRDPFTDLLEGYMKHLENVEALARRRALKDGLRRALDASDSAALSDHLTALNQLERARKGGSGTTQDTQTDREMPGDAPQMPGAETGVHL